MIIPLEPILNCAATLRDRAIGSFGATSAGDDGESGLQAEVIE
jgi:hypothetical protein